MLLVIYWLRIMVSNPAPRTRARNNIDGLMLSDEEKVQLINYPTMLIEIDRAVDTSAANNTLFAI